MRNASCKRVTGETDISMELNLDGTGCAAVATGHAFLTICWIYWPAIP